MESVMLDQRYLVSSLVSASDHSRRFAGCHVWLNAPVQIVELRPPNQSSPAPARSAWDAARCASLAARAAALHHPVLPRVRDSFCAGGICYVVEDPPDGARLTARLAHGAAPPLRDALRDGLHLCDAVARVAAAAPEMLVCLLIATSTLAYDADGMPHLTTWDYARWSGGRGTLDPGMPDLRAPELRTGARPAPDERSHVYSIAALLALLLTGSAELPGTSAGSELSDPIRAALEPALHVHPHQRTPSADALGRALARAARASLPALSPVPTVSGGENRPRPQVERGTRLVAAPMTPQPPLPRQLHVSHPHVVPTVEQARRTAPRAIRQARKRSRAAVEAALRRAGRALTRPSCA